MKDYPIAISITTIAPDLTQLINAIEENRLKYKHTAPLLYVITGDRKTPPSLVQSIRASAIRCMNEGIDSTFVYMDLNKQYDFLTLLPGGGPFAAWLPFNCIARRSVGDLYAYFAGAEVIIRLDADNIPIDEHDFLGSHRIVGSQFRRIKRMISSASGWFNYCEEFQCDDYFYPRGFPYEQRRDQESERECSFVKKDVMGRIAVNQGVWLGDPDVDAVTRLELPNAGFYVPEDLRFALDKDTWSPINTQNTAIASYLLPVSFVSPFFNRFDDIMCGYFQRTAMDIVGDFVMYGMPFVRQDRFEHNVYSDLALELPGMAIVNDVCQQLRGFIVDYCQPEKGNNCIDYLTISEKMSEYLLDRFNDIKIGTKFGVTVPNFYETSLQGFHLWSDIFRQCRTVGIENVMVRLSEEGVLSD
jgi:hypothetical protein